MSPDVDFREKSGALSPTVGSAIGTPAVSVARGERTSSRSRSKVEGKEAHLGRCATERPGPQRSLPLRLGEEVQAVPSRGRTRPRRATPAPRPRRRPRPRPRPPTLRPRAAPAAPRHADAPALEGRQHEHPRLPEGQRDPEGRRRRIAAPTPQASRPEGPARRVILGKPEAIESGYHGGVPPWRSASSTSSRSASAPRAPTPWADARGADRSPSTSRAHGLLEHGPRPSGSSSSAAWARRGAATAATRPCSSASWARRRRASTSKRSRPGWRRCVRSGRLPLLGHRAIAFREAEHLVFQRSDSALPPERHALHRPRRDGSGAADAGLLLRRRRLRRGRGRGRGAQTRSARTTHAAALSLPQRPRSSWPTASGPASRMSRRHAREREDLAPGGRDPRARCSGSGT